MHFPVVYSTLCEQALKEWIEENYAVGKVQRVEFLLRGMNDTYKVHGDDASCNGSKLSNR